jgi:hypothetical protein
MKTKVLLPTTKDIGLEVNAELNLGMYLCLVSRI